MSDGTVIVSFRHNGVEEFREISLTTLKKLRELVERINLENFHNSLMNIDNVDRSDDVIDLMVNYDHEYDYNILFDILEGKYRNLQHMSDDDITELIHISGSLNIDPREIIRFDRDRFARYFNLRVSPRPDAMNVITNYDLDIYLYGTDDLDTVNTILHIDYLNKIYYAQYAMFILLRYHPEDVYEHFKVITMLSIILRNLRPHRDITPLSRRDFRYEAYNRLFTPGRRQIIVNI